MSHMIPVVEYFNAIEAAEYLEDPEAEAGNYARLSAPGYLDCTDWQGPYPRAWMALRAVCEEYDVLPNGENREDRSAPTGCPNCQVLSICGVPSHEQGCPSSWRNPATGIGYPVACWECGCDYTPEEKPGPRDPIACPDCIAEWN